MQGTTARKKYEKFIYIKIIIIDIISVFSFLTAVTATHNNINSSSLSFSFSWDSISFHLTHSCAFCGWLKRRKKNENCKFLQAMLPPTKIYVLKREKKSQATIMIMRWWWKRIFNIITEKKLFNKFFCCYK